MLWVEGGKKKSGVQFNLVTYVEEYEASTRTDYEGEREMMWEKQALEFWQTIKGGQYTEEEAQEKWNKLNRECDIRDQDGPEKKPLRLAVKTHDVVKDVNSVGLKRKMVCEEKGNKKATKEDLERMGKRIMMNHQGGAAGAVSMDLESLASTMVKKWKRWTSV